MISSTKAVKRSIAFHVNEFNSTQKRFIPQWGVIESITIFPDIESFGDDILTVLHVRPEVDAESVGFSGQEHATLMMDHPEFRYDRCWWIPKHLFNLNESVDPHAGEGLLSDARIVLQPGPGPLNDLAQLIHGTAVAKGFWDQERNMGEMLMLMVSELAEALEEHRDGHDSVWFADGSNKPEGVAVELADCIIRALDTLRSLNVDIDGIIKMKMDYNDTRPYKHGKKY